jgi:hypothetical protein
LLVPETGRPDSRSHVITERRNTNSVTKSAAYTYNFHSGVPSSSFETVDNFVADKASNFNKVQQTSTGRPQLHQQESLRINKNP